MTPRDGGVRALLAAAHFPPTVAVTAITALLALSQELTVRAAVTVTAAVLAGQLTIGWGNDLVDVRRDRQVGRVDKPLATGALRTDVVVVAIVVAAVLCTALSLAAGWRSAVVHLGLVVGGGHAYNLGLKATVWSWIPYAVAFGSLPGVVTLAGEPPALPPWWLALAAAGLGVGAHILNALPDLDDDGATGVCGLPHRLGLRLGRLVATGLLVTASVVAVLGPAHADVWTAGALVVVALLAAVALAGRGRAPFQAAMLIALVDVGLLVAAGPATAVTLG